MTEHQTSIEFATPSDAIEIATMSKHDIEHDLGWRYTPERIRRLINHESKNVVVARSDNTLVGFGIMTYHDDHANLDLLAVKRGYRRMGIGARIVAWLEKVALTAGNGVIFVQVRESNRGAIEFYERLGFIAIEEAAGYYRGVETAVIMSKSLRPMFATS